MEILANLGLVVTDKLFSEGGRKSYAVLCIQGIYFLQMQNISNVLECLIAYFFTHKGDLKVFLTSMFVLFFRILHKSATVPSC